MFLSCLFISFSCLILFFVRGGTLTNSTDYYLKFKCANVEIVEFSPQTTVGHDLNMIF